MGNKQRIIKVQLVLLVISHILLSIESQWVIDDEGCRTPRRGVGTCTPIRQCAPMMEYLQSVVDSHESVSSIVANFIRDYQCGFSFKSVKVCCPKNGRIAYPNNNAPPDVSQHINLKHLPYDCGISQSDDRIIGGRKTALFEFPWMALISYRTKHGPEFKCGGTIIHPRYILTAAHCLTTPNLKIIGVRVGEHNIASQMDCEDIPDSTEKSCSPPVQDIAIEEIIPHPKYNTPQLSHDVGLLRLETPIDISVENAKPICLPTTTGLRNSNFTGSKLVVTGWGITDAVRHTVSYELLKVALPVMSQEECSKLYEKSQAKISFKHMCVGGAHKQDSCSGDSGGPAQRIESYNSDARTVQHGIVSFGPRTCGQGGIPGVYTRVAYYLDWILDNIKP